MQVSVCSALQTNGTTCSSKITVQFSGEPISLMCYGFLYAQQQNGKLFNITIGEYTISKEGKLHCIQLLKAPLPALAVQSNQIQPHHPIVVTPPLSP